MAKKVTDLEYNLLMQNDINTTGHTQWFFFRVTNTTKDSKVKFNILNFSKPDSLFNLGMKVSIYSEKTYKDKETGWFKGATDISYYANGIKKDSMYTSKPYYSLSFTHEFEHSDDTVFFAYSLPYSYSDLKEDLIAIETDPLRCQFVARRSLCTTLGGVSCDYLTITSR